MDSQGWPLKSRHPGKEGGKGGPQFNVSTDRPTDQLTNPGDVSLRAQGIPGALARGPRPSSSLPSSLGKKQQLSCPSPTKPKLPPTSMESSCRTPGQGVGPERNAPGTSWFAGSRPAWPADTSYRERSAITRGYMCHGQHGLWSWLPQ